MFGSRRAGAFAYQNTGIETGIMQADPHQLIQMLFEGARMCLGKAIFALDEKDALAQGLASGNALAIISQGLNNSLSWKADPGLANRLSSLYEYMQFRLHEANAESDRQKFEEVDRLLAELESAWVAIKPKREAARVQRLVNATNLTV